MDFRYEINDAQVTRAFAIAPEAALRHAEAGLGRGAQEIARDAKRAAPKAFSTLVNAIAASRESPLHYRVAAGVNYAIFPERGTGPGGHPPHQTMLDWIRVKRIEPRDPSMSARDLAFVIARSIARKGTKAQPYMRPALFGNRSRVLQLVREGALRGLRETGRA